MWPNPKFPADVVTFAEEILNGNFIFCAVPISTLMLWSEFLPITELNDTP